MSNIKVWAGLTPLKALGQDPPCLLQRLATSLGSVCLLLRPSEGHWSLNRGLARGIQMTSSQETSAQTLFPKQVTLRGDGY